MEEPVNWQKKVDAALQAVLNRKDEEMSVLRLDPEIDKQVRAFATKHGLTAKEAADKIMQTGLVRLGALARYAKKQKAEAKPKAKKARKAKK
jgi:hypothetical protein